MTNAMQTKTAEDLQNELAEWRKTWTLLVQGYKRRGERVTMRNLPQDLATVDWAINKIELDLQLRALQA